MKYLVIIFLLIGCAVNPAPPLYKQIHKEVSKEMFAKVGYDNQWMIPRAKYDIFGMKYRTGNCTNYASLYRYELNQSGIAEDNMKFKIIVNDNNLHAILVVDNKWVLDNLSHEVSSIYYYDLTNDDIILAVKEGVAEAIYLHEKKQL